VQVVRTHDPLLFERAAFVAVTGQPPERPGELHPAGSAEQPGLALFLALSGGEPVGTALSVVHPGGLAVSAVGVRADHRRRGIGALLSAAAVDVASDRPATLTASALGERMYRELGFERVGQGLDWRPPG
jgi:GNAT superfamily N-acetyltransferase